MKNPSSPRKKNKLTFFYHTIDQLLFLPISISYQNIDIPVPAYRPYLVSPPIATRRIDDPTHVTKLNNIIFLGRRTCVEERNNKIQT